MHIDEQIQQIINARKAAAEPLEPSREQIIARFVREGILPISGDQYITFRETALFDGKFRLNLPEGFTITTQEAAAAKYPTNYRPQLIYTDETNTINIIFKHTDSPLKDEETEAFKDAMMQAMKQARPIIGWYEDGATEIGGKTIGYFDLLVPTIDLPVYNFLFFFALDGRAFMAGVNCPETEMELWQPIAKGIMESLQFPSVPETAAVNECLEP